MAYGKGDVEAVMGKLGPPKAAPDDEEAEGEAAAGEDQAAADLTAAFKSGDAAGVKSALKDFIEICYPELAKG